MHQDSAWNVAISICKQNDIAEDVVQNAFVNAYRFMQHFRGDSSFKTWLIRIVYNEAYRQTKKEKRIPDEDDLARISDESIPSLEFHLEKKELHQIIRQTLARLQENEALVMNLYYLEELSTQEIREVTDWSISNVKVQLHRARKNFKRIFEELNDSYELE